jgi:hypothetical protein
MDPKVHYRVHKGPSLISLMRQMHTIHISPRYSPKIHFNIIFHLCLDIPSSLFPSDFLTKILYVFINLSHACYMLRSSHPPWFDPSNNIW